MNFLNVNKLIWTISLLIMIGLLKINPAFSFTDEKRVENISRISHPAYRMTNLWYGTRNPWNRDNTRIMMFEETATYNPPGYGTQTGRGAVWGFVSELKAASGGTLAEYQLAARPLYDTSTKSPYMEWSVIPGEENIIYALFKTIKKLKKMNLDTQTTTDVISYDPGDGTIVTNARIIGWTADNTLIVNFDDETSGSGGFEINVVTNTRTRYSKFPDMCSAEGVRWPFWGHGHNDLSPDGLYHARYGKYYRVYDNDYQNNKCGEVGDPSYANSYFDNVNNILNNKLSHVSWLASNYWFLASDVSDQLSSPYKGLYRIVQVFFDRATKQFIHNELWSGISAGIRLESGCSGSGCYRNFMATPHVTVRPDGNQMMFQSTDGKWGYDDYVNDNSLYSNWGAEGVFIADLATASGAQACTDFTYTAWSECQPSGKKTRSVISSIPTGCSGGKQPEIEQVCTYNPANPAYNIPKTPVSPIINGNLSEFASVNAISFSPSSGGNTVTVRALRDSEALYLGISVTDTQLNATVNTRDGSVWNDDSIEWFIDTLNNGGGAGTPNSAYMLPDDYQGIVNILGTQYDSQGTTLGAPSGTWNGSWQVAVKLNGTTDNNTDIDSGYTVEIKIPWKSIGYSTAPSDDTIVGMSFAVNDKDASSSSGIMWPNISAGNQNASNWQKIMLSGTVAVVDTISPAPPLLLSVK
ncbi:hypothetical protein C4544_05055 [candidate division WS5 bacterium]|uniref:Carbohydrate-binding domain-containing protein n=1 Tax=candidate division WS5 bacterium TaxID=2093353 RepID=A0A419DBG1_9BACT|nr:MAG: hypothetical protein C4544_05055 [candidate division WS5 bacterium]